MRKVLKVVGILLLLAGAWLALVLTEWLPPQTEAQRAALELLEREPASVAGERNAFAAMWLFGYDVPEGEIEQIAAADAAAFEEAARRTGHVGSFESTASDRFPALPAPPSNDPLLCETWSEDSCLARIRRDPEASRARLAAFSRRLENGDRLAQYDHYRYGFLPRFDSPIAGPGSLFNLQATAAALDYLDGRTDAAFARLCRDTAAWRRLRAHADALIIDMLGVAQMTLATRLYAEMLAEQPAGFVPPCQKTFAPLVDEELNQCAVMRGEYLFGRNSFIDAVRTGAFASEPRPSWFTATIAALINQRHVIAVSAENFAQLCGEANRERVRHRDPAPLPGVFGGGCSVTEKLFDPFGCEIALLWAPDYNPYYQRVLDLDARLRLLNTAIWLRGQPADGDRVARFASRPEVLQAPRHAMELDVGRGLLRMRNLQGTPPRSEFWEIPIAQPTAAATLPAQDGE